MSHILATSQNTSLATLITGETDQRLFHRCDVDQPQEIAQTTEVEDQAD